jgi:hypothetical protein
VESRHGWINDGDRVRSCKGEVVVEVGPGPDQAEHGSAVASTSRASVANKIIDRRAVHEIAQQVHTAKLTVQWL